MDEAADFPSAAEHVRPALARAEPLNDAQKETARDFLDDWRALNNRGSKGKRATNRYRPFCAQNARAGRGGIFLGASLVRSPTFRAEAARVKCEEPFAFSRKVVVDFPAQDARAIARDFVRGGVDDDRPQFVFRAIEVDLNASVGQ